MAPKATTSHTIDVCHEQTFGASSIVEARHAYRCANLYPKTKQIVSTMEEKVIV